MKLNEGPNGTPILDRLLSQMDAFPSPQESWERVSGLEDTSAVFNRLRKSFLSNSLTKQDLEMELSKLIYDGERVTLLIWLKRLNNQCFENILNS